MQNSPVMRNSTVAKDAADKANTSRVLAEKYTAYKPGTSNQIQLRTNSAEPLNRMDSRASIISRQLVIGDAPSTPKHVHPPRSNQLTDARNEYNRKFPKKVSFTQLPPMTKQKIAMQKRLKEKEDHKFKLEIKAFEKHVQNLQSQFLKKVRDPRNEGQTGCTYKLVTIVQDDNSKLLVDPDELVKLPMNLPANSANDLKNRIHDVFENAMKTTTDRILSNLRRRKYDIGVEMCQKIFDELQPELNKKWQTVDDAILQLCCNDADKKVERVWHNEREQLESLNLAQRAKVDFLKRNIEDMTKERNALKETCCDLTKKLDEANDIHAKNRCGIDKLHQIKKESDNV